MEGEQPRRAIRTMVMKRMRKLHTALKRSLEKRGCLQSFWRGLREEDGKVEQNGNQRNSDVKAK